MLFRQRCDYIWTLTLSLDIHNTTEDHWHRLTSHWLLMTYPATSRASSCLQYWPDFPLKKCPSRFMSYPIQVFIAAQKNYPRRTQRAWRPRRPSATLARRYTVFSERLSTVTVASLRSNVLVFPVRNDWYLFFFVIDSDVRDVMFGIGANLSRYL